MQDDRIRADMRAIEHRDRALELLDEGHDTAALVNAVLALEARLEEQVAVLEEELG